MEPLFGLHVSLEQAAPFGSGCGATRFLYIPRCQGATRSQGLLVGSESTYFKDLQSYKTGNLGVPNTLDLPFLDILDIFKELSIASRASYLRQHLGNIRHHRWVISSFAPYWPTPGVQGISRLNDLPIGKKTHGKPRKKAEHLVNDMSISQ